ncbi:hypothetical protein [Sporisorium scitamineum]|nr:hypothetical protein [Sporisorium scitamineum]
MALDRYASRFVELGIVCVVFDYRHFGESGGRPRQLLDIQRQLEDWEAAIEYTVKLEFVDEERVGLGGSSFSGGHVISMAAKDGRVRAVVAQCPFTSGLHLARTAGLIPLFRLATLGVKDLLFSGKDKVVPIKVAGKPGETAMMNTPDAFKYRDLIPPHLEATFKDYIAARFVLNVSLYNPGWKISSIHCPILFAVCGHDSVTPPGPTLKYIQKAPKATIKHYTQMGHFDPYTGTNFDIATKDYMEVSL